VSARGGRLVIVHVCTFPTWSSRHRVFALVIRFVNVSSPYKLQGRTHIVRSDTYENHRKTETNTKRSRYLWRKSIGMDTCDQPTCSSRSVQASVHRYESLNLNMSMKQCRAKDQQAQQIPDSADDSQCPSNIIVMRKPQSPEDAFTFRAVSAIEIEGAADSWYHILPARMTQSSLVNLCMRALVFSSEWARGVPGSFLLHCYHALTAALYGVRHTMSTPHTTLSDETLVAVAALSPVEGVLRSHALLCHRI